MAAGDRNWREFVGPKERWDSQAAFQFCSLISLGLRERHYLCDVGCGSLRAGRLFIPYLERCRYHGIEPEGWLLEQGITEHVGHDLKVKRWPTFIWGRTDFPLSEFGVKFDYVLAQSILTHTGPEQVDQFLAESAKALAPDGMIVANWQESRTGRCAEKPGWTYPGCVPYTEKFMREAGLRVGLRLRRHQVAAAGLICSWGVWEAL